ncbi:ribonuclease H2 non-catalytic subunit [Purpureocillium lilacinum]|nr:ribonuclease H2 non-catalytic subunit [Purpureocillium lilacinum]KAK4088242.1 hypothetical protein Purlil1_7435 [Purpureocillium lilacinum]OAQ83076.1 ribonuclease H2 non-catalytic subunit [Purpureocillium lilacinum]PWI75298.1 hypothetical protein PCL_05956 [Purpureocillium lilacinum]GJN70620.1 hypothetical protein PLICBS_004678 [Purpureocillium lilacinum]
MSQSILAIERDAASRSTKAVPNLLPCRIHHNGSVDPVASYWNPERAEGSASVAYFRGRKLKGTAVSVPNDFEGVVVERKQLQDKAAPSDPQVQGHNVEDADADVTDEGVMRVTAEFDEVAVWSHEVAVDSESDPYIRSIEEWLHVSEQIHSHSDNEPSARK